MQLRPLLLTALVASPAAAAEPVATFSIVGADPATGEVGVVGGVVALIAASQAIAQGWGPSEDPLVPGRVAMVEARSDSELRGVVLLG